MRWTRIASRSTRLVRPLLLAVGVGCALVLAGALVAATAQTKSSRAKQNPAKSPPNKSPPKQDTAPIAEPVLPVADAVASGGVTRGIAHAIAMHGAPALPSGFTHFPYVNPDAPKGGQLRLGATGAFDSLNGFIVKGQPAPGLREYVYDSLLSRSADEPFTLYGLVAAGIEVSADARTVTFHLRPEARFSDGAPLTSADVEFSHRVLRDKGLPFYRSHYKKVARVEAPDARTVRFIIGAEADRELPLILGLMPLLPRHRHSEETFEQTTLVAPIGSGPYTVGRADAGRSITYRRNPEYWARDLAPQRGRYNFDEVRTTFYRDNSTMFEAFKAGEIDARVETEPSRWAEGYDFPAVRDGRVTKREVAIKLPAGMSGLAFNTRRPPFDDQRVRQAFIQMFDAEWMNTRLFQGLYRRTASYFARSDLASTGRPGDTFERTLLARFPGAVSPALMDGSWRLPETRGSGAERAGLLAASHLLADAGFSLQGGRMVHTATGRPLTFEFLASSRTQERLVLAYAESLKRLGIAMRIRQVDSAQYWGRVKSFDFDMLQWSWGASLSPGNEQINRWSSQAAAIEGTLNFPGVKSPAADAMIDALLAAERRADFESAVRALDRVLLSGDYVIPLFYAPGQWLAYWNRLAMPEQTPLAGIDFDTWWAVK